MPSSDSGRPIAGRRRRRSRNARHSDQMLLFPLAPSSSLPAAPCADSGRGADPRHPRTADRRRRRSGPSVLPSERRPAARRNPARRCGRARTISPSMMQSGSLRRPWRWPNLSVQSSPLRVLQRGFAVLDAQLHAIAVELDLMAPSPRPRAALDQMQSCGSTNSGIAAFLRRLQGSCSAGRLSLCFGAARLIGPAVRIPHRVRLAGLDFAVMNGFGLCPCRRRSAAMVRPDATD
jgi:hypothetical protein